MEHILILQASSFAFIDSKCVVALLYADPGSGALVWQLVLASLVSGLFYARSLIGKVKTFASRKFRKR